MSQLLRGVGYTLMSGARSWAGWRRGQGAPSPFPLIDTTADPFEPGISGAEVVARMRRRYGERYAEGVDGVHAEGQLAQYMEQRFARAQETGDLRYAPWLVSASQLQEYDGRATSREYTDVYYSRDGRVKPLVEAPAPQPVPQPPPPTPVPPPVTPPPAPAPQPPPVPAPGLSSVEQRVRELVALIDTTVQRAITPPWVQSLWSASTRTGLADVALTNAVRVKRRILGE